MKICWLVGLFYGASTLFGSFNAELNQFDKGLLVSRYSYLYDSKRSIYIWKLTCLCVFLNKREVLSCFFGKSNIFKYVSTCQTRSYDFWIINAMCTFVYLFVVYFSFAPVISASIRRYVKYFDIQILMMVTETETLTSTLHHNIFTYLDYVFSATFTFLASNMR